MLSWQHRITWIRERCRDLWGREGWRWRVVRISNADAFRDPQTAGSGGFASKFENPPGTPDQENSKLLQASAVDPNSPLETRFAAAIAAKDGIEQGAG